MSNIGDVTARLAADTSVFDAKLEKSAQTLDRTGTAAERASARVRAAWEKELLAQERLQQKLVEASRAKELAALKSDILSRSLEHEAQTMTAVGHAGVTSVQAASGAIRELEGNFTNNIRAVEKFVTLIPGIGAALKIAFPVVGALSFGAVLLEQINNIREWVKEATEAPSKIRDAYRAMHNEAQTSNDELRLTNDRLQNEIDKLEGKPQNNLAIAIDEARIAADKLYKSLADDSKKSKELLEQYKIGAVQELLLDKGSTANVSGSVKSYRKDIDDLSYQLNVATHKVDKAQVEPLQKELESARKSGTPQQVAEVQAKLDVATNKKEVDDLNKQLKAKEDAFATYLDEEIRKRSGLIRTPVVVTRNGRTGGDLRPANEVLGDQSANLEILRGERSVLYDRRDQQAEEARTGPLQARKAQLDSQKAGASELLRAMEEELNQQKLVRGENVKADFDFWEMKKSAFRAGSEEYRAIVAKEAQLALEGARKAAETIRKYQAQQKAESTGAAEFEANVSIDRVNKQRQQDALKEGGIEAQAAIDSNQLYLLRAHNEARQQEAEILERAGRTMTQYAAAVELARVHEGEFAKEMQALEAILHTRELRAGLDPSRENTRAVAEAQSAIVEAQARRQLQVQRDTVAINGRDTSSLVGATDALNDFIKATQDGATQLRGFVDNTLNGLNANIIRGISGQKTDFANFGADMFRNVAGIGLTRAEGSILSLLGLGGGKKPTGTVSDPLYVKSVDAAASIPGVAQVAFSSLLPGGDGGESGGLGSLASTALQFLPGFADGGMIDPNQWAIVGEEGPELFHSGRGGEIIPNHKLDALARAGEGNASKGDQRGDLGGDTHYHNWSVDASGASDPAAFERALRKVGPSLMAGAVKAVAESKMRRPSTRRS